MSQRTVQPEVRRASRSLNRLLGALLLTVLAVLAIRLRPDAATQSAPVDAPTPPGPAAPPPALSPPATTTQTAARITQTRWTSDWANIREGRGLDTPVLRILRPGQRVQVDSLQGRWWVVYLSGERAGYVHTTLLQGDPPSS